MVHWELPWYPLDMGVIFVKIGENTAVYGCHHANSQRTQFSEILTYLTLTIMFLGIVAKTAPDNLIT